MTELVSPMAQRLGEVATAFQRQITGRTPSSVNVLLGAETLVITLHGVLSPAERALANSAAGAAELQDYHRQLFSNSYDSLRQDIQRITGAHVSDGMAEIMPPTGMLVASLASGTVVQVFLLGQRVPLQSWSGADCVNEFHS